MNVGARLVMLAPGEKFMPVPDERGVKWMLRASKHGNARMLHRKGVLYLSMMHGKVFPSDLTGADHDRAAALGWLLEGQPVPWGERYPDAESAMPGDSPTLEP